MGFEGGHSSRRSAAISRGFAAALLCAACHRPSADPPPPATITAPAAKAPPAVAPAAKAPPAVAPAAPPSSTTPRPTGALRELTWRYDSTPLGPSEVVIAIPEGGAPDQKWPVLVAFHGRGESLRGAKRGARGWVDDYALPKTVRRLTAPPLTASDFLGFVTDEHLAELNQSLTETPYRGLIVVCPFLPDILRNGRAETDARLLAGFVVDELLPRVYRETPALGTAASTGIDGVSLGGRAALYVGFERPEAFGAIGALQPALDNEELVRFADFAEDARAKNPRVAIRLLTSDEDYFLEPTHGLSRLLQERHIEHRYDEVTGTHSYEFNRGPGGYEMLLFHDRALRSAP
ncbi:MAG TPA: alpha/beta hydrolase-fold protein [Polyangiaceae bacterium]|nr:alpha/beta hydrolase-fold protein [Polyangiaceae bacterium]